MQQPLPVNTTFLNRKNGNVVELTPKLASAGNSLWMKESHVLMGNSSRLLHVPALISVPPLNVAVITAGSLPLKRTWYPGLTPNRFAADQNSSRIVAPMYWSVPTYWPPATHRWRVSSGPVSMPVTGLTGSPQPAFAVVGS